MPLIAYNISHAKSLFVYNTYVRDYLDEIVSHWGYEFYPEEVNTTSTFGGWISAKYSGIDCSLHYCDNGINRDMISAYEAGKVNLIRGKGKKSSFPETLKTPLWVNSESDIPDEYFILTLRKNSRFVTPDEENWDSLHRRRKERFEEYRSTVIFPLKEFMSQLRNNENEFLATKEISDGRMDFIDLDYDFDEKDTCTSPITFFLKTGNTYALSRSKDKNYKLPVLKGDLLGEYLVHKLPFRNAVDILYEDEPFFFSRVPQRYFSVARSLGYMGYIYGFRKEVPVKFIEDKIKFLELFEKIDKPDSEYSDDGEPDDEFRLIEESEFDNGISFRLEEFRRNVLHINEEDSQEIKDYIPEEEGGLTFDEKVPSTIIEDEPLDNEWGFTLMDYREWLHGDGEFSAMQDQFFRRLPGADVIRNNYSWRTGLWTYYHGDWRVNLMDENIDEIDPVLYEAYRELLRDQDLLSDQESNQDEDLEDEPEEGGAFDWL